jgi:predicted protein tyrosine phosphatase
MFELKITGISQASGLIQQGWPTRTISLIDTIHQGGRWIDPTPSHLITYCDDCERDLPQNGYTAPTREQIAKILDFTKDLTDDDIVLVHCHAGISRSTAMALGILVQHGMDPIKALSHLEDIRPILYPNQLIVSYIDEILGLEGRLGSIVTLWKNQKKDGLWTPSV